MYDTYGFPLDLTELMARERGLTVDVAGFNKLMEEQKARARAAQKKTVIELSQIETKTPTKFIGFDHQSATATVLEIVSMKDKEGVILDVTPFYAEMGGQVGDTGTLLPAGSSVGEHVINTTKSGNTWIHWVHDSELLAAGMKVTAMLDWNRRPAIQRHHTVTHLLHWALHEVVSKEASQKGSAVDPTKPQRQPADALYWTALVVVMLVTVAADQVTKKIARKAKSIIHEDTAKLRIAQKSMRRTRSSLSSAVRARISD